jgi:hypothetical protein
VVALGEPGQTALERHRNIGSSEIEHDQTEAARAQELLSRDRDACSMKHTNNNQCGKINSAVSRVRRIKKLPVDVTQPTGSLCFCASPTRPKARVNEAALAEAEISVNRPAIAARFHGDG